MKFVPFRSGEGDLDSRAVFKTALESAPRAQQGGRIGLGDLRGRLNVLDKLEAAPKEGVTLEDAEWTTLQDALRGLSWPHLPHRSMAWLLDVEGDVNGAKAPEVLSA